MWNIAAITVTYSCYSSHHLILRSMLRLDILIRQISHGQKNCPQICQIFGIWEWNAYRHCFLWSCAWIHDEFTWLISFDPFVFACFVIVIEGSSLYKCKNIWQVDGNDVFHPSGFPQDHSDCFSCVTSQYLVRSDKSSPWNVLILFPI